MADVASQNLLCAMKRFIFKFMGLQEIGGHTDLASRSSGWPKRWGRGISLDINRCEGPCGRSARQKTVSCVGCVIKLVTSPRSVIGSRFSRGPGRAFSFGVSLNVVQGLLLLLATITLSSPTTAQEDADGVVRYAPGATGSITTDLVEMMRRAKQDSEALKDSLNIQGPMSRPAIDLDEVRDAALSDPRVRKLLGADGEPPTPVDQKWQHAQAFMFASFSMSAPLLREMMEGAARHDIPVVFRGFHKNSVFETQQALVEVFGSLEAIQGFSIDPTLFTHFDVEAVPTLVLLKNPYEMCETQACGDDTPPAHDVIKGGIKVDAALEIISRGAGEAADVAERLRKEAS